jgi:hypothetical protein
MLTSRVFFCWGEISHLCEKRKVIATHTMDLWGKKAQSHQILRFFFFEIARFRQEVPTCQNIWGFLNFFTFLSDSECSPVGLCYCERRVHLMGTAWNIHFLFLFLRSFEVVLFLLDQQDLAARGNLQRPDALILSKCHEEGLNQQFRRSLRSEFLKIWRWSS